MCLTFFRFDSIIENATCVMQNILISVPIKMKLSLQRDNLHCLIF